jgi:cellulose synthase/poly-beta-1,6-N-acetylglucosamine synthase-like glycosyltransferase
VRLFRQEGRVGKTITQNNAVEQATGEIILFSDATTMYQPDVLRRMLPNFADKTIGCVAGKLVYVDDSRSNVGKGAKSYWSYETFIKESESRACSLIGASGCLYAVRKSAYKPMYAEACSDFLIATKIYEQGLRSVYEPTAICTEETNRKAGKELQMRVRVISQTFNDLWRNRRMLNPFHGGFFAVELFSHKLLRYAAPLF